jgi:structural maintenance of chromosome 2
MYIEEIIIDGFKSYSCRTAVSGFDPHFNAITGLNGSGKSNILDAICFVLGISNLGQVRVSKLQQLVYKQGQTGVTRASVSIVFNNEASELSPVGYQDVDRITVTRQIVVGGKNKYLINGRSAQAQQVQNLFHSVQLNINNPHFLIMQGRITKVLNMKPPEILGMIEEAAGTRMFEEKKAAALDTIEKKDSKLAEIENIIANEIQPTLERLERERETYLAFQHNKNERDRLERFVIAYNYTLALKLASTAGDDVAAEIAHLEQLVEELVASKDGVERELAQLERSSADGRGKKDVARVEKQVTALSKDMVKAESHLRNLRDTLKGEQTRLDTLFAQQRDADVSVAELAEGIERQSAAVAELENELHKLQADYATLQRSASGSNAHLADEGGRSLADQIMDLDREIAHLAAERKCAQLKIDSMQKDLKAKQQQAAAVGGGGRAATEHKRLLAQVEAARTKLEELERAAAARCGNASAGATSEAEMRVERKKLQSHISELSLKVDRLTAQLSAVHFEFESPRANFDRSRVKGVVVELAKLKDSTTATALNVAAGGRLFNVIVDNEETGKAVLTHGKLKKRVTIIPLNKIQGNPLNAEQLREVQQYAGKDGTGARVALDLVTYDDELQAAMEHVFGRSIVCADKSVANKLSKNPKIRCQAVTLEGDLYEPSGALTGGSRSATANVLMMLEELDAESRGLAEARARLAEIEGALARAENDAGAAESLTQELEMARQTSEMLRQRLESTPRFQLERDMTAVETAVAETTAHMATLDQRHEELTARQQQLSQLMSGGAKKKGASGKGANDELAKARALLDACATKHKGALRDLQVREMELESARQDIDAGRGSEQEVRTAIAAAAAAVEKQEAEVARQTARYQEAKRECAELNENVAAAARAVEELESERNALNRRVQDARVQLKSKSAEMAKHREERERGQRMVAELERVHRWIPDVKALFGRAGTVYDFNARSATRVQHELEELEAQQESLKRKLNAKVMNMYEKADEEFRELVDKRKQLTRDRKTLMDVIEDLDQKKKVALQETWKKVNGDFGSIFSTLLQGTMATLQPPEGQTVLDGLEVHVSFAGVDKSLTELSGGQRSLLALSLILSLLLYKPAPMYILDEVDAALDLSHTENIGKMLRKHFSQSQFIVVSLKEGMFKNANVVFRTKFVDGTSTVERIASSSASVSMKPQSAAAAKGGRAASAKKKVRLAEEDEDEYVENV